MDQTANEDIESLDCEKPRAKWRWKSPDGRQRANITRPVQLRYSTRKQKAATVRLTVLSGDWTLKEEIEVFAFQK